MFSVLLVCSANICRSPMAEGLLRAALEAEGLAEQVTVDSAGVNANGPRQKPDVRAVRCMAEAGIDIGKLRSRPVTPDDYTGFDLLLAMDNAVLERLVLARPEGATAELGLYLGFAGDDSDPEVPDPYFGNEAGFQKVLDLLLAGTPALTAELRRRLEP